MHTFTPHKHVVHEKVVGGSSMIRIPLVIAYPVKKQVNIHCMLLCKMREDPGPLHISEEVIHGVSTLYERHDHCLRCRYLCIGCWDQTENGVVTKLIKVVYMLRPNL